MSHVFVSSFLRRVLAADALISGVVGAVVALGGTGLQSWLHLPVGLLVPAGLGLLGYAAWVVWLSRQDSVPRAAVWFAIACNLVWAVDCVATAAGPWFEPNLLGEVFLGVQVVTVLVLAELEFVGLRRSGSAHVGPGQPV
ncbi:MAG: hypothetical protein ABI605_22170 [Rhizobacter sp.]